MAVAPHRRVDRPAPRSRLSYDERQVLAGQGPSSHQPLQPLVGLVRARNDEQSRRVSVEAVHDPGAVLLPTCRPRSCERVRKRAAGVSRSGMDNDPRGLVHDEEVVVRVGDRELGRRNLRRRSGRLRRLDRDLLPACELVALAARMSVHENGAGFEQSLGSGP